MTRPLTKREPDGAAYIRPASMEREIDAVLLQLGGVGRPLMSHGSKVV
jgi:hypothetical protein